MRISNAISILIVTGACVAGGCKSERSTAATTSSAGAGLNAAAAGNWNRDPIVVSGLRIQPQPGWLLVTDEPARGTRVAQFTLAAPATEGSAPAGATVPGSRDATLIIYHFGPTGAGNVQVNLDRWIGQFEQPGGGGGDSRAAAVIDDRTINGLTVNTIDLAGTYIAETTPGSGERLNEPNWRLLGAIVRTAGGPYYIKLVGPAATVTHWSDSYRQMLAALAPAPVSDAGAMQHP